MNIEELINMLDDIILSSWSLPLTNGQCVINREKVKDVIQDIRLNLPNEIRQARAIVVDKNDIIERAKKEANMIVEKAKKEAEDIVSQEATLKIANERATEVVMAAQTRSKEIKSNTNAYCEGILENLEDMFTKTLLEVKQTRQQIKSANK